LWSLRHTANSLFQSLQFGGGTHVVPDSAPVVRYLPTIPSHPLISGNVLALDRLIDDYMETVMGGACMVESMMGLRLGVETPAQISQACDIILTALNVGFGYVTSSKGRLILIMDMVRAALPISPMSQHAKLKARKTDVNRTLRNFQRNASGSSEFQSKESDDVKDGGIPQRHVGSKLSLRVNTNFKLAVDNLRAHHKQAWVGPELEVIWQHMYEKRKMFIFELWLVCEDKEPEMIAADIGHPVGKSFYVATRFFQHKYKNLQPGFLLALLEIKVLRGAGFKLWDLGGTDQSAMMSYKYDIAETFLRPSFSEKFRVIREGVSPEIPMGLLIASVSDGDLANLEPN